MPEVIRLPVLASTDADEQGQADTDRTRRLFDWVDVLKSLGLDKAVTRATSIAELRAITLDLERAEITLAIRDALYPASGCRLGHFQGLRERGLKRILKNRFVDLKTSREAKLRRRTAKTERDWTDDLILDGAGNIKPILANLVLILSKAPKWKSVLAFNEFAVCVIIRTRPPWGEEKPDTPWNDHRESLTRIWFQKEQINPAAGDVGRAVQAAAKYNSFHPVREYFDALRWDGVARLETWLISYFHAADTPYIRAIGPRYLMSAVARIYRPGCKVDHVLVLEGPQGKQKSEALRTLAINDEWFSDRLSHIASKDAALEVAGVLLIEIAEMDALTRASSSAIKSFLTRRHDRFRPLQSGSRANAFSLRRSIRPWVGIRKTPPGRGGFGRSHATARLTATASKRCEISCGRRRCIASRAVRHGGSKHRNSKRSPLPSKPRDSSSMHGKHRFGNGLGIGPTPPFGNCSNMHLGCRARLGRKAPRIAWRQF
jgi:Virulence-associated protein E